MRVFTLDESHAWNETVRSFPHYDVYYLSGYVKAFKIHGDGEPLLFYYESDTFRAADVVMKRDVALDRHFKGLLPEGKYFDLATPYGYGGWIADKEDVSNEDKNKLFGEYLDYCRENGIISDFVRFHPLLGNNRLSDGFYEVIPLGKTVAIDLSDKDGIWTNMKSECRNRIRKAINSGVTVHHGSASELYETFRSIYNSTMDDDNAENYYYFGEQFYNSVREDLNGNAEVFYAVREGKTIASTIMLYADDRLNFHLGGSLREDQCYAPTNLIFYEAALWGCERGLKTLHLGGGVGSSDDNLMRFKRSFYRGDYNQFYIGRTVLNRDEYDRLCAMRTDDISSGYFPAYRA